MITRKHEMHFRIIFFGVKLPEQTFLNIYNIFHNKYFRMNFFN